MIQMQWFRAYSEMVDDEKLRLLAFEDRWHYVALLCCKSKGLLDAGDSRQMLERKLAVKLGLQVRELEAVVMRLAEVGLIDSDTFQPTGWENRQFVSDADPTAADRKRRQRERLRRASEGVTRDEPVPSRVTVTNVTRTDTDTDTEQEQKQEQVPARKRARPADAGVDLPEWVPADAWTEWMQVRARMRVPNTPAATRLNLNTLQTLRQAGEDPRAVLEQSISRGWRGLFSLKDSQHGHDRGGASRNLSAVERVRAANARAGYPDA